MMAKRVRDLICDDCGEHFGTTPKGISLEPELCPDCREHAGDLDMLQNRIDSGDTRGTGVAPVAA